MLCQNCGENEANVRYTQIVNGVKKEMILCEKCSKKLGIGDMDFNMPINLSSFLSEFLDDEASFLPSYMQPEQLICNECGMTYEEFLNNGKFGCENCYEVFSNKIDPILKNIHGGNKHVGRVGKIDNSLKEKIKEKKEDIKETLNEIKQKNNENSKIEELKKKLKMAIKEEKYEEAAKIRDEIKELEK